MDVLTPEDLLTHAIFWLRPGVQVLGGRCGLGPEHSAPGRERLPAQFPRSR